MRGDEPARPTNRSLRNPRRESGQAPSHGDRRWRGHYRLMTKERNPLLGRRVVVNGATAEFVSAVGVPDQFSVAEGGDDEGVAAAVSAAQVRFHDHRLRLSSGSRPELLAKSKASRIVFCRLDSVTPTSTSSQSVLALDPFRTAWLGSQNRFYVIMAPGFLFCSSSHFTRLGRIVETNSNPVYGVFTP